MTRPPAYPGDADMGRAIVELASRLPPALAPLAEVAFDLGWTWAPDGPAVFEAIDPDRWRRCNHNPVVLLRTASLRNLARAAADPALLSRVELLAEWLVDQRSAPSAAITTSDGIPDSGPIAFMCAEFGVHDSLPIYSGGLGVLAGDILKEASDMGIDMVAVGLLYRTGYFHQRIDTHGLQHEYWLGVDPEQLPCVPVTDADGEPVEFTVEVLGGTRVRVWRADVGRVPLYLLDSDVAGNSVVGRWVTSRLYEGNRHLRLAQYAVLGVGGARALDLMGITPSTYHINEGHPALAAFELARILHRNGVPEGEVWNRVRDLLVFTTHTPVPAGNETYGLDEITGVLGNISRLDGGSDRLERFGRIDPDATDDPIGLTPFAIRTARSTNGVSDRHGEVAREMWQPLFPGTPVDEVPIGHVTNGVHVPTWTADPMRHLLDRHLGDGWWRRADLPETWDPVADIPDGEIWAVRNRLRATMVQRVGDQALSDRLRRGEDLPYVEAVEHGFSPDRLTIGFARRLATYKRLYLLAADPVRALGLLSGDHPVQFFFAGKAHPRDEEAKLLVQRLFALKEGPDVAGRVAFLEDYNLSLASALVAGCDVWVNLPRPPQEASGTSGMKSVLNGGLQLSVLDGWWAEAYDGTNGWAIEGAVDSDEDAQDERHATALMDLAEQAVVPLFHRRDADGVPVDWVAMIKSSLRTNGPRFSALRMMRDYTTRVYPLR